MKVVGKAPLPAADLSRHVQVELPGPRAEALLFVHRPRFAARATPIVARNYAFLAACFEAYEMCILFASLHSQQFRTCSSRCVLIFWRTFGAGGPRRCNPRRSSPSSRAACGRASRAREERKITLPLEPRQLSQMSNRNVFFFFSSLFLFFLFFLFSLFFLFFSQMSNRNAPSWIKCRLTTYKRGARVGTVRKTTTGHHQLALALTHHGVRKEKKNFKKEKISEKRILLVV